MSFAICYDDTIHTPIIFLPDAGDSGTYYSREESHVYMASSWYYGIPNTASLPRGADASSPRGKLVSLIQEICRDSILGSL